MSMSNVRVSILGLVIAATAACSSSNPAPNDGGGGGGGIGGASSTGGTGGSFDTGGTGGVAATGGATGSTATGGAQMVGLSGGTVERSGVTLTIPAGALPAATPISVTTTTSPAGFALASEAFKFGPDGTTFASPVTVTLPLTAASPSAHLFWSNATGGFDDLGGTVNGLTLTGYVTHFSTGFAATPSVDGGTTDAQGDGGATVDASSDVPTSGDGGATSDGGASDVATTPDTGAIDDAGATDASATPDAGATDTAPTDAATVSDASTSVDASSLCVGGLNAPFAMVTYDLQNSPPAPSTYTGGTLTSGTYYLRVVKHFGNQYGGPTQESWLVDATAKTIRVLTTAGAVGVAYSNPDAHTLQGNVVCNTTGTPMTSVTWSYSLGQMLAVSVVDSADVLQLSIPAAP
ncbi:MAG TPA: hypothetical protein VHJ20_11905 [Polyangia bacterium]|nr:hypothetical protein [Polyangia bacterium]